MRFLLRGTQLFLLSIGVWVWVFLTIGSTDKTRSDWYGSLGAFCSNETLHGRDCANAAMPLLVAGAAGVLLTTASSSSQTKAWMTPTTAGVLWTVAPAGLYATTRWIAVKKSEFWYPLKPHPCDDPEGHAIDDHHEAKNLTVHEELVHTQGDSEQKIENGGEHNEESTQQSSSTKDGVAVSKEHNDDTEGCETRKPSKRHLTGVIANAIGMISMWAYGYSLIPVAKQAPLLKVFGLDEIALIQSIHIWAGYIVVIGATIHSVMFLLLYHVYEEQTVLRLMTVPWSCFTRAFTCDHVHEKCSCHNHIANFVGGVCTVCLLLLTITSHSWVRRKAYAVFYLAHAILAPLSIVMIMLHWSRPSFMLAPGALYYIIVSVMTVMESTSDVSVVSVQRLASTHTERPCYSLTVAAVDETVETFRAGQYVKLWCRALSNVGHPFTINRIPGQPRQMRIIFRSYGSFTTQLGKALTNTNSSTGANVHTERPGTHKHVHTEGNDHLTVATEGEDDTSHGWPTIGIRGYLGKTNLLHTIQQYDVVSIVAGGVGITPYLTLLHEIRDAASTTTKHVTLRWVCRDPGLITYIHQEYFQPLLSRPTVSGVRLTIVLHSTFTTHMFESDADCKDGSVECVAMMHRGLQQMGEGTPVAQDANGSRPDSPVVVSSLGDEEEPHGEMRLNIDPDVVLYGKGKTGRPFFHARLHGDNKTIRENLPGFLLFSVMCLVGMWVHMRVDATQPKNMFFFHRWAFVGVYVGIALLTFLCAGLMVYGMRGRRFGGPQFSLVTHTEAGDDKDDNVDDLVLPSAESTQIPRTDIQYLKFVGRPNMAKMLHKDLVANKEDCDRLAVIQCGPVALMESVRKSIDSLNGKTESLHGGKKQIALLEETVEM